MSALLLFKAIETWLEPGPSQYLIRVTDTLTLHETPKYVYPAGRGQQGVGMGSRIRETLIAKKYTTITVLIFLLFLAAGSLPDLPAFRPIVSAAFIAAIIFLERMLGLKKQIVMLGFGLGLVSVAVPAIGAFNGLSLLTMPRPWAVFDLICNILFYVIAIVQILKKVLEAQRVTQDTIAGGVAIYFLLGIFWAQLYRFVLILDPGAFSVPREMLKGFRIFYFSFTTLTTLGFGDVIPLNPMASVFVVFEAAIGQIFLAVFVARLVGLYIANSRRGEPS